MKNLFTSVSEGLTDKASEQISDAIMCLAAETHVDRSINGCAEFIHTNIIGTYYLLVVAKQYWQDFEENRINNFRSLHVSIDEVYCELGEFGFLSEETPYDPKSPYSYSIATSYHLVMAFTTTMDF